mgnify:FL=1
MITAELKAGEHLPTERWRKDVLRALDLLDAELHGCEDYAQFFHRANGGGNIYNGRSIVLYDRLGDKLNYFGDLGPTRPLISSGRYLLITALVRNDDDPYRLVTPLERLHRGELRDPVPKGDTTGMVKLRADWLTLLYGDVDIDLIADMIGCGVIPPEVELDVDLKGMLFAANQVIVHRANNHYPWVEPESMLPDYYAMLTESLLEALDEVRDLYAYGDKRTDTQLAMAWMSIRSRIQHRYGLVGDLKDLACKVLRYRHNDDLAKIVWLIHRYSALAAALAA